MSRLFWKCKETVVGLSSRIYKVRLLQKQAKCIPANLDTRPCFSLNGNTRGGTIKRCLLCVRMLEMFLEWRAVVPLISVVRGTGETKAIRQWQCQWGYRRWQCRLVTTGMKTTQARTIVLTFKSCSWISFCIFQFVVVPVAYLLDQCRWREYKTNIVTIMRNAPELISLRPSPVSISPLPFQRTRGRKERTAVRRVSSISTQDDMSICFRLPSNAKLAFLKQKRVNAKERAEGLKG